jgi:SAM-dependent methyltransferase
MLDDDLGGYEAAVDYLPYYFAELNPVRATFSLLLNGHAGVPPGPCCELGFGQGLSLAIHAAAGADRPWWGTDFNAAHVLNAAGLLRAADVTARIEAQSFAEFCRRDDLPQFAFIGLHGVWSWISAENRELIADFLRRRLMPGGVVYVSYNTLPGWVAMLPVRQIMVEHTRWMSAPGLSEIDRARAAVDFVRQVAELEPPFIRDNPALAKSIRELVDNPAEYLVHEYFVRDWHPMAFSDAAGVLEPAGLTFAGDARSHERMKGLQLGADLEAVLAEIPSEGFRESVRDLMLARRFRRDLWVRGGRPLPRRDLLPLLDATRVVLGPDGGSNSVSLEGQAGEISLDAEPLGAMLRVLRDAEGPVALGQLIDCVADHDIELEGALAMISVLAGARLIEPAQGVELAGLSRPATSRFNAHALGPRSPRASFTYLASPVTGGGFALPAHHHAFLAAYVGGLATPRQWAERVFDDLDVTGGQVTREGHPVTDRDEALDVLQQFAQRLNDVWLPALRRMQVVE